MTDLPRHELERQLVLAELVNRVLDRGAVITGEVLISVAGVDLIYLGLQVVLTSVETARERGAWPTPATTATP